MEEGYTLPIPTDNFIYNMASESTVPPEENPYEHMQGPTHQDNHVNEDKKESTIGNLLQKISDYKIQIAISVILCFNIAMLAITIGSISQERQKNADAVAKIEDLRNELKNLETRYLDTERIKETNITSALSQIYGMKTSLMSFLKTSNYSQLRTNISLQQLKDEISLKTNNLYEDLAKINDTTQNQGNAIETLQSRLNIIMQSSIRLAGHNISAGRVEIYYQSIWGTVCDDGWDVNDARVVCRMLGFSDAVSAPIGATYGQGRGTIWLDSVNCTGMESTIFDCEKNLGRTHDCSHNEDASVVCSVK